MTPRRKYNTLPTLEELKSFCLISSNGCWVWQGNSIRGGYGMITTCGNQMGVHRLAYQLATGKEPGQLKVLHECDNPPCCNPKHLFLGTQGDNIRDRNQKNRTAVGTKHSKAKLTESQVLDIRATEMRYGAVVMMAKKYGVSEGTIGRVRARQSYFNIE